MSTLQNPSQWFLDWLNGGENSEKVTPERALRVPSVWYAVNKICSHVGQLPIDIKQWLERGAKTLDTDYRWRLMRQRPNGYQTPSVFKEQMTLHMLLMGDARAFIARDPKTKRIIELVGLPPKSSASGMMDSEKVHVSKIPDGHRVLKYMERDNMNRIYLFDSEVIHLPNLSIDGICGEQIYDVASDSLRAALSADKRTATNMQKGFAGKVLLEAPNGAFRSEKDATEFLDRFKKHHSSDQGNEEVGLLREGIRANVLQMTNNDAQFIEQRAFMRQEAALWFLLETIVGDDSSVSYNSLEQKTLAYLQNTLNRWLRRWEEELDAKCLSESEQGRLYFKFNTGSLLRSDLQTTLAALNTAVQARIMSPNEAREKLDMNPYEGGDTYANPAITPGTATETTGQQSSARAAIVSRLQHLLGVEENRVNQFLDSRNPMKKVEAFYQKWQNVLGNAIEELGGDREIAVKHCQESIEALTTGADVHRAVNSAEELADLILKGCEECLATT